MQGHVRVRLTRAALPAMLAAAALLWAEPGAAARSSGGTIDVCAAADLGASGAPVLASLNGGAPFAIQVGRCTGPRPVAPGTIDVALVSEAAVGVVDVRPASRRLATDAVARTATAGVPGGSTAATRTIVTFAATPLGIGGPGSGQGAIEVCASADNGMADRAFQFALNGGASFSVLGGSCSGELTTRAGANLVQMLSSATGQVTAIDVSPFGRTVSLDAGAQRVVALAQPGLDGLAPTRVTFTVAPPGGGSGTGDLKICKTSRTPSFQGRPFSFSLNAGPAFSIEAGSSEAPVCSAPVTYAVGTRVVVQELATTNVVVDSIAVSDGRGSDVDPARGAATATVGTGTTVVTFDNEPSPVPQMGYVEVCKDAEGPDVTGLFDFVITAPGFSRTAGAYAGQCTGPIEVPAGYVALEELARPGFELYTVATEPSTRLIEANLINRTMTVEVPAGDPSTETQVHFVNRAIRGQLKVCKALAADSGALADQVFLFDVTRHVDAPQPGPVERARVRATAATTQCVIAGWYPVGEIVRVDEVFAQDLAAGDSDAAVAQSGVYVDVSGEGTSTIAPGINSVTVSNRAVGLLTICKARVPEINGQPLFRFRIDGGGITTVRSGTCTPPSRVSVGAHTIVEMAENDYELDLAAAGAGIDVYPVTREVARNAGLRTVTVSVPYGADGETRVLFANRVRQGAVKVCKQVTPGSLDSLGSRSFGFTVTIGGSAHRIEGIRPGECSTPLPAEPILHPDGTARGVVVVEDGAGPGGSWAAQAIACSGCRASIATDLIAGEVRFTLAPATSAITFTNTARG